VNIANVTIWNAVKFAEQSRHLDQLARGDFEPIQTHLDRAFPNTDLPIRAIPFVQRYVAELAGLYSRPVVRRFFGTGLADPHWQKLQAAYTASQIDRALEKAEASLWTQNTVIAFAMPVTVGQVRLQTLLPWQIEEIQTDDPMRADDPATWTRLDAQVPIRVIHNQVAFGRLTLTRTTATREIDGRSEGIYAPDGSHPFGRVPVAVAYRIPPDAGRSLAAINEAVLNLQVSLSLQEADNELIIRNCAWPQKWIKNATLQQLVETISWGPDKLMALRGDGNPNSPPPELAVTQGQVPVSELVAFSEHKIRLYCAMLGLDPAAFLRVNTAVTAAARLFSAQDRAGVRNQILPVLAKFETDVLACVRECLELREPMRFPRDLAVTTAYQMAEPEPDPQSAAQALTAEIAVGVSSPVDPVMRRDGVSRTKALATVQQNLAESRALGLVAAVSVATAPAADGAPPQPRTPPPSPTLP